jgi:hypothetical protein
MIGLDVDLRRMRAVLREYLAPSRKMGEPLGYGPTGLAWKISSAPRPYGKYDLTPPSTVVGSILVTQARYDVDWVHASLAWLDRVPTYDDLVALHRAVFADRYAFQVFAPPSAHVNLHGNALHLWGRADGRSVLPMSDEIERLRSI